MIGGSYTVVPGDGTAHFGLAVNLFDPPPCTKGYEARPARRRRDHPGRAEHAGVLCRADGQPIDVAGRRTRRTAASRRCRRPARAAGRGQQSQSAAPGLAPLVGLLPGLGSANLGPAGLARLLGLPG
ncbi:hypothetical protein [Kutzneria kofuensis]|uniref:hypothetical protein n=1 Tax=Kutzneria kofuensis TaxID=103725 RepID=UPI0031E6C139